MKYFKIPLKDIDRVISTVNWNDDDALFYAENYMASYCSNAIDFFMGLPEEFQYIIIETEKFTDHLYPGNEFLLKKEFGVNRCPYDKTVIGSECINEDKTNRYVNFLNLNFVSDAKKITLEKVNEFYNDIKEKGYIDIYINGMRSLFDPLNEYNNVNYKPNPIIEKYHDYLLENPPYMRNTRK